jgi:hypothetical protein
MSDSTDDNLYTNAEKTFYTFDNALFTSGYVEICQNTVHLHFPELSPSDKPSSNYKCVQIFINDQLRLSFNWLPFYSFYDRIRIMDMFIKSYELYSNLIQGNYFSPFPHTNKSNHTWSSIDTQCKVSNSFETYCSEDYVSTSIKISICKHNDISVLNLDDQSICNNKLSNKDTPTKNQFFFKISIGSNCVIDSKRDFQGLEQCHINYLVQFLLYKIIHVN